MRPIWGVWGVLLLVVAAGCGTDRAGAEGRADAAAADTTVVFLVRHAEKADDGTADPPLTEAGVARAEWLGRLLAGEAIDAVYTTPYRRTRETAEPVARAAGVEVVEYDPDDLRGLASRLRSAGGRALVVGHSNTTPALVRFLGGDPGPPFTEDEYDRLYRVTVSPEQVRTELLRFGAASAADSSG